MNDLTAQLISGVGVLAEYHARDHYGVIVTRDALYIEELLIARPADGEGPATWHRTVVIPMREVKSVTVLDHHDRDLARLDTHGSGAFMIPAAGARDVITAAFTSRRL